MQTDRTIVTRLIQSDFYEVLEMYGEPDTFKFIEPAQNKTRDEYISFLDSRIAQINEGTGYHWVARMKEDSQFIGLMNLNSIKGTDKMQVGFQLRRKFWHRGLATELAQRVLEFAINEARLKTVYGVFIPENIASGRIFIKLGFKFNETVTFEGEAASVEIWKYTVDSEEYNNIA